MAGAGRARLLQLSCRADQCACTGRVPAPCHRPLATHAAASQPKGSADVGTDDTTDDSDGWEGEGTGGVAASPLTRAWASATRCCSKALRSSVVAARVWWWRPDFPPSS